MQPTRRVRVSLLVTGFSLAFACTAAQAQENVFPRLVGEWREPTTATSVIIRSDGNVFTRTSSPISGSVAGSITGGGNFTFENEKAQCSYNIALYDDDTKANWGLANEVNFS
jgi:hypothetical protein